MDTLLSDARGKMQHAFDAVWTDLATIRTGKATPALLEHIVIHAYGGSENLKVMELATIHVQDPTTLVITPFDQSIIGEIQKGILEAHVGINPIVDRNILRVSLPPLTEERRKELVKLVNQKIEGGRIMVRQVRQDAMREVKKMGEGGSISEDEVTRLEKEIQKMTDEFMEKIDTLRLQKEEELLKV